MKKEMSEKNFLRQSYIDAQESYQLLLSNNKNSNWDWVVITASNEHQAKAYELQLKNRKEKGYLPVNTQFIIVPDLGGKRIGSGGATLNVIKYITEKVGIDNLEKQKILIIHSGGDSKRIPQYSACGKLFSPIPRILSTGEYSTLFDELLMSVSRIPSRISAGMLILPGDTEVLFNPLQLELLSCDAAALSIKTNIIEGKEHGVFIGGANNIVQKFLHKQSESILRSSHAVDSKDNVDIDTGCIWFGHTLVRELANLFFINNIYDEEQFLKFVNDKVRLSFYADFVSPLSEEMTWEEYKKEKPEGSFSEELLICRKKLWNIFHKYKMSLVRMMPAKYIHIGRTVELFRLMVHEIYHYHYLDWEKQLLCNIENKAQYSGINSLVEPTVQISDECYIENCILKGMTTVPQNTILSGIIANDIKIPKNVVLHTLKLKNGKYVCRIYGLEDNPKGSVDSEFLQSSLRELCKKTKLDINELCNEIPLSIWNAKIYMESDTSELAVEKALLLHRIITGKATDSEIQLWKNGKRYSLQESFEYADVEYIILMQEKIKQKVFVQNCITKIKSGENVCKVFDEKILSEEELKQILDFTNKEIDIFLKMKLYLGLSYICKKYNCKIDAIDTEKFEDMAYEVVKNNILNTVFEKHTIKKERKQFVVDKVEVELPVRVNFCGSPSDAAPYCLEYGGTMLDGTLLLKGKMPIKATIQKIKEPIIKLISTDLKSEICCTKIEEIQNCGNPYDTFALHKAILVATSLIPQNTMQTLEEICTILGGGFILTTSVNVPKGSGLGTSSILAAAAIKAVHEMMGQKVSDDVIYAEVFATEQLMNTGGGWQDQAGGLTAGIKFMYTKPGIYQEIKIDTIYLEERIKKELENRFALIFSGQRRLAKNVLREEMNKCLSNDKQSLDIVEEIRTLCLLMRFELEQGNIKKFGKYITKQFELIKQLDKGASNTYIEYIFDCCDDLIDGKSICGAGGGGFLQVILKEGVSKDTLKKRIEECFENCGVEVWDSSFIW